MPPLLHELCQPEFSANFSLSTATFFCLADGLTLMGDRGDIVAVHFGRIGLWVAIFSPVDQ